MSSWKPPPMWSPGREWVRLQILVLTSALAFTLGVALLCLVTGRGGRALQLFAFCVIFVPGLLISWQQWRSLPTRPSDQRGREA
ncbi:hypothetical protein [Nocardioides zeae]|uniref:Uncharacterized protein n=1 Tax=Nocardioides zeae TaxID=1457234 RepID=A0AAJ1X3G5_9ACTN|nr:hypothetical protein [Nocardioides zeae]MDQ1106836.1 hypothetical protein [Nocardioides zeae]